MNLHRAQSDDVEAILYLAIGVFCCAGFEDFEQYLTFRRQRLRHGLRREL